MTGVGMVAVWAMGAGAAHAQDMTVKPTAEHAALASEVGTWRAEVKAWEPGAADPVESEGQEVNRMLAGIWLISDFTGKLGAADFQGHGITGYDPAKKKYVGTWVDSMSSNLIPMEGTYDAKTKTLTLEGKTGDPSMGGPFDLKNTSTLNPDGTRTMTMFMKGGAMGDAYLKLMEVHYTKLK
jgi:hypothetical protein